MNNVLSTGELAQRLKMSKGTLCNWRTAKPKRGPRYRIYYRLDDVLEYEKEQTQIIET